MAKVRQYIASGSSLWVYFKFILWAVIAGLIIALILPPILENIGTDPKSAIEKSIKSKAVEKTADISNLVYEGQTDNAHFKITAQSLKKQADGIDLITPNGVLKSSNGITTTIAAKIGTYSTAKQTIDLKDGVEITSNRNTLLQSRHITINIKTNTITSHGRTTIERDGLKMQGDGAIITDDNVFKLQGNVKVLQTAKP